jgi:ribonuclease G
MAKELVINTTSHETRISLLENGHIAELYIERNRELGIVGNIYRGRVIRVLPGMQAAFVDIGLEKAAFLYVADVLDEMEAVEHYVEVGHRHDQHSEETGEERPPLPPIEELLQEGQEILVQVAKEPLGTKGARITSHISLPGRNLVYMPTVDHVGISRRIENEEERDRLKHLIDVMRPEGTGFIVRTVAESRDGEELKADMDYLVNLWEKISAHCEDKGAPCLIHSDLDVTSKVLRDILTEDVSRIVVDSPVEFDKIGSFLNTFMPGHNFQVDQYKGVEPIFDSFGLEVEIARALGRKVWLKSGGYIIIEQTEALTAKEAAFQLRLRNIGGLIIIDFIDMEKEAHREKVHGSLEEVLKNDKSKTNILKISELGLVEMTRKRVRESIGRTLCEACPYCDGKGYVKSRTTTVYEIFRELQREMGPAPGYRMTLLVHPDIASLLYDDERHGIEELEKKFEKQITITARQNFHLEQFEIIVG